MEDFSVLSRVNHLVLYVHNQGHAFGAGLFHVLRMCSDLEEMALALHPRNDLEVRSQCESGCVCDQPSNWKTDELTLNHLQEVVIIDMTETDHEVAFVKQLINWAVKFKRMRLIYRLMSVSKAKEAHEKLLSFAMPETCVRLEEYPRRAPKFLSDRSCVGLTWSTGFIICSSSRN
ncbi:unnamed protein product [Urochloa decumbens]|uniref:FBD domain-containing protein n=1 Tax=Urochloa decumbens TaxID=240449 RepID=A0ABC9FN74_9POAL